MSVGCTCARRTVPNEDAGGRSSPPGAPSSLPPSPHHLPIPSLHVLAALLTFSPPCSSLLLPSRGERDSDAHNKSSSRGSFFKPHFILTRTGAQTRARVKPRNCGCSKCDSAQQTTWVLCVRARARACVLFLFFFSFLFLVGSGGNGGGGGWEGRYETRVFMSPSLPVICDWPPAQFHLYERPCNCDRNSSNEVSMEEQFVVLSVRAEFGSYWCQDISG